MKKFIITFLMSFLCFGNSSAEDYKRISRDVYIGKEIEPRLSAHKLNYFTTNGLSSGDDTQYKFQVSMKLRILEPNLYFLKYNLFPLYISYTQKSLWNIGQPSMPIEESNYNPEVFLDYPVNMKISKKIKLRNVVFSPIEHESNGLNKIESRCWNRQYIKVNLDFDDDEFIKEPGNFSTLYVRLWRAWNYEDEEVYLAYVNHNESFLDYMGRGEVGISLRGFLWEGNFENHQLDIRTPIFRDKNKDSWEFQFQQYIPYLSFTFFFHYFLGYGETLMRFDKYGKRFFAGFCVSY